jgi:8-oxo-dGTP diphosphatase
MVFSLRESFVDSLHSIVSFSHIARYARLTYSSNVSRIGVNVSQADWVDPAIWYKQLPTVHVAALALISDPAGNILLVKPNYRPYWTLPGGMADKGESPDATVAREVKEELGITFVPGRLAVVDWAPPQGKRQRPLIAFVFDGGVIDRPSITLQHSELDEWDFFSVDKLGELMPERSVTRIRSATQAAHRQATLLLVDGLQMSAVTDA